jgi:hypothetical protein
MSQEFFDSLDVDGIVEDHATAVVGLQEDQAKKIVKAYSEIRQDLQDRLLHARFDSFTAQRLRSVLAQIDAAIDATNKSLHTTIGVGADHATRLSLNQLVAELHRFDRKFTGAVRPINLNVAHAAIETKDFLMNHYQKSLSHYSSQTKVNVARALSQAALQELPYSEVVSKVGQFFEGQEWEIHRIARTELHHIYSVGKLQGMKELKKEVVPDLMKGLFHPMDSRTGKDSIELSILNPILPLNEPFEQNYTPILKNGKRGKTQHYEFMTPPNRPNDRAILIPVRDQWLK